MTPQPSPAFLVSSIPDVFALLPVEDGNIAFAKSPLFALLEGRQDILSSELIHRIWAKIQNNGNLPAVQQLLFSFQHNTPSNDYLEAPNAKKFFLTSSTRCVKANGASCGSFSVRPTYNGLFSRFKRAPLGPGWRATSKMFVPWRVVDRCKQMDCQNHAVPPD
jgi:hypothetical protein